MQVAVTGASGQLGTLALKRLLALPEVERVRAIDVQPPLLVHDKLDYIKADVRDDDFSRHLEGCTGVFHFAFIVTSRVTREFFDDVNINGSKNVFRAAAAAGVDSVVYASSVAAYGVIKDHPVPLVETSPRIKQPEFPYANAKFEVEAFLDEFEKSHDAMRITRLRPAILIGTRFQNPLAVLLGRALDRGILPATSEAPLPLVWDDDVAAAAVLALQTRAHGAFNVGAEEPMSMADLGHAVGMKVVRPPKIVLSAGRALGPLLAKLGIGQAVDPTWAENGDATLVMDSSRARSELGWKPICDSVQDVLRHYREVAPGAPNPKITTFIRVSNFASQRRKSDPNLQGLDAHIHLELLGKGGGDFTIRIEDEELDIKPGIPRPPTSVATMDASYFLGILAGEESFSSGQMTGRVHLAGDTSASFAIGAMVRRFQTERQNDGLRGRAARAFSKWLGAE